MGALPQPEPLKSLTARFAAVFGHSPERLTRAPGRVNLLGEHVDYNGGVVLPAAIDRWVSLVSAPTRDGTVSLEAVDLHERVTFRLDELDQRIAVDGQPLPSWAHYPAGVAWAMQRAGLVLSGLQAVYSSNIPIGAGLSSSAAVEVAFARTWEAYSAARLEPLRLAQLCQQAENEYVGVASGLMDQFASACGVEGHVLCFDTRSLEWSALQLPPQTAILIADSGIRRSLTSSAYNDRRAACEQAVKLLKGYLPGIHSLRDVSSVELAAYGVYLPEEVHKRAEHVVKEIHRVEQALIALRERDARRLGGFMYASHKSLRDLYQVSLPELDYLVEMARRLPGVYGARLTGAGFGGCTVNLVEAADTPAVIASLQAGYLEYTGREANVYLCQASAGAQVTLLDGAG